MVLSDIHNKSVNDNLYIKLWVDNCDVIHIFCKNCGKEYENVHNKKMIQGVISSYHLNHKKRYRF